MVLEWGLWTLENSPCATRKRALSTGVKHSTQPGFHNGVPIFYVRSRCNIGGRHARPSRANPLDRNSLLHLAEMPVCIVLLISKNLCARRTTPEAGESVAFWLKNGEKTAISGRFQRFFGGRCLPLR